MKKILTIASLFALSSFVFDGCSSSSRTYLLPEKEDYQGFKIIDGVDKNTLFVKVDREEKIAVVIRDIATTSYSYLEPRYMNSMVSYEGRGNCCMPTSQGMLVGSSGNLVYKFAFLGKGNTTIKIIARHKGESVTANKLEDDIEFTINVEVN